jgi:hypothetical protein
MVDRAKEEINDGQYWLVSSGKLIGPEITLKLANKVARKIGVSRTYDSIDNSEKNKYQD